MFKLKIHVLLLHADVHLALFGLKMKMVVMCAVANQTHAQYVFVMNSIYFYSNFMNTYIYMDLLRLFVVQPEQFVKLIQMTIQHPVYQVKYVFDIKLPKKVFLI